MENTENTFTEPTSNPILQPKWFHNVWISRSTLLIAGLFFLLPFITINCSGNKLASIRGTDMVFGSELKPETAKEKVKEIISSSTDSISENIDEATDSIEQALGAAIKEESPFTMSDDMMGGKDKKIEPNALAIVSFGFILLALVFSFFKKRAMAIISGVISLISAGSLFFIQVQIANEIQKQMGPFNFIPITFEFTSFYWLTLLFLTIATIFSFIRSSFKLS